MHPYTIALSGNSMQLVVLAFLFLSTDKIKSIFGVRAAKVSMVMIVILAIAALYYSFLY
jgi:hypothetical protein